MHPTAVQIAPAGPGRRSVFQRPREVVGSRRGCSGCVPAETWPIDGGKTAPDSFGVRIGDGQATGTLGPRVMIAAPGFGDRSPSGVPTPLDRSPPYGGQLPGGTEPLGCCRSRTRAALVALSWRPPNRGNHVLIGEVSVGRQTEVSWIESHATTARRLGVCVVGPLDGIVAAFTHRTHRPGLRGTQRGLGPVRSGHPTPGGQNSWRRRRGEGSIADAFLCRARAMTVTSSRGT